MVQYAFLFCAVHDILGRAVNCWLHVRTIFLNDDIVERVSTFYVFAVFDEDRCETRFWNGVMVAVILNFIFGVGVAFFWKTDVYLYYLRMWQNKHFDQTSLDFGMERG